jgi:hypothetical protein
MVGQRAATEDAATTTGVLAGVTLDNRIRTTSV